MKIDYETIYTDIANIREVRNLRDFHGILEENSRYIVSFSLKYLRQIKLKFLNLSRYKYFFLIWYFTCFFNMQ